MPSMSDEVAAAGRTTAKRRAFISVSNKRDVFRFGALDELGTWEIISSGGTAKALTDLGIEVTPVEQVTNMREMMGGRLKTVHPQIFGPIIADRANPAHLQDIARENMGLIDLVVVNFYNFKGDPSIENIDVGGPTNVAATAKNYASVTVVTDPADYSNILHQFYSNGNTELARRKWLASKAFRAIGQYYTDIGDWMLE